MTIKLSPEAETYVAELMKIWGTDSPDEAVSLHLAKQQADDALERDYPEPTEEEFYEKLREAERAPHYTYEPGDFRRMVDKMLADRKSE